MLRTIRLTAEHWPLLTPFRIARGIRTQADLVVVEIEQDGVIGRGEGVPLPRYGQSTDSCLAQLEPLVRELEAGLDRGGVQDLLPPGAARNALDCALWDLEARLAGRSVEQLSGLSFSPSITTAATIGLASPAEMKAAARRLNYIPLLKIKSDGSDPGAQIRAVREAAPDARLIVDANESWTMDIVETMQPVLAETGVQLLEQPLPSTADEPLLGFKSVIPICADESCHTTADLQRISTRYQAINIKLDKTGGLTEAIALLSAARGLGLQVMTGCMICTSLSIAPAHLIAGQCDFADLDGPTWLSKDRLGGCTFAGGQVGPPTSKFWGGP